MIRRIAPLVRVGFVDLLFIAGVVVLAYAASWLHPAGPLFVIGAAMVALAWLLGLAEAKPAPPESPES